MNLIVFSPEVEAALAAGQAVVALESSWIGHGLPRPRNLEVAFAVEQAVRDGGATPATIAVLNGQLRVGLTPAELEYVATDDRLPKLGLRDLAVAVGRRASGVTTVASTAFVASRAGIDVFSTGGLGGVHRLRDPNSASRDVSGDLPALATSPVIVVCAGIKSILDIDATLELLETLSVPVVGWRTRSFPAFYVRESGHHLDWQADSTEEIAQIFAADRRLGRSQALIVANPLSAGEQLNPVLHERAINQALAEAEQRNIKGKAVTPYLLDRFGELTGGASIEANINLLVANAGLAAAVAIAMAGGKRR